MSDKDIAIRYTIAWVSMIFIAIFNGITRGLVFETYFDTLTAHQLSSVTLVLLFFVATWLYSARWEIGSSRQAILIGLIWVILTPIFEFTFGMYVMGHPLEYLLNDYNLLAGRVWSLVMVSIFLLPTVVYQLRRKKE
jgi:hypothetical protein